MLALAGTFLVGERGAHRQAGIHAGQHIGDGDTDFLWPATGFVVALAGDGHQSAHALENEVIARAGGVGAGLAKASHRAIHQPRIDGAQVFVAQAVFGQCTDLEVLQHHIAFRCQLADQRLSFGMCQIDRDGLLAAID